jgi:hypothetical protein
MPLPEDFPGGNEFLHEPRRGEVEEAAAISELFVFFLDDVRTEQTQAALELVQLVAGHGVVCGIDGTASHDSDIVPDSLFVRLRLKGNRQETIEEKGAPRKCGTPKREQDH